MRNTFNIQWLSCTIIIMALLHFQSSYAQTVPMTKIKKEKNTPKKAPTTKTAKPISKPKPKPQPKDSDGDGVVDDNDKCPNEFFNTDDGCPPAEYYYNIARNQYKAENYSQALRSLAKVLDKDSTYPNLFALTGDCYFMRNEYKEALYYFNKAFMSNNTSNKCFIKRRIAFIYFQEGDYSNAVHESANAIIYADDDEIAGIYFSLSYYFLFADAPIAALEMANSTLQKDASKQAVNSNKVIAYLMLGQLDKAFSIYSKWMGKYFPDDNSKGATEIFYDDIIALEEAGIYNPYFYKVKQFLGKVPKQSYTGDTDEDGIADKYDKCLNKMGVSEYDGCPFPDTDGDGVIDKYDKCPNHRGAMTMEKEGCP